jgi:hypothetical protein
MKWMTDLREAQGAIPLAYSPTRGRLINVSDRLICISLIREAAQSGCRLEQACEELGLSVRTFERWVRDGETVRADGRSTASRPEPSNKLSEAERQRILEVANSAEFASLPPNQIVPSLADRGRVSRVGIELLPRVAKCLAAAPPRSGTAAFVTYAHQPLCDSTESTVVVGHHLVTGGDQGQVLLLVHGARCT